MNRVSVSRGGTCSRKMLCLVGLGNDNPQQVRDDKIHENELLSDTVELALRLFTTEYLLVRRKCLD